MAPCPPMLNPVIARPAGIITHVAGHQPNMWGISSAGRALAWHARGQRFDPAILHQKSTVLRRKYGAFLFLFQQKDQECTARHAGGPVTPPISIETVI